MKPEVVTLDTLSEAQLKALCEVHAPKGSLKWYVPRDLRCGEKKRRYQQAFTPQALGLWVNSYARRAEAEGRGTQYPTFQEVVSHFEIGMEAFEDAIEDYTATGLPGGLDTIVGMRVGGQGGSIARIEGRESYQVEAYL